MASIKSKNSLAERIVFSYLRREGIYFQRHYRNAPAGCPDLALPRKKRAVFIDGGFWHGKNYEKLKPTLSEYWTKKIGNNIERDFNQNQVLLKAGWLVMRLWEEDILRKRTRDQSLRKIKQFLQG